MLLIRSCNTSDLERCTKLEKLTGSLCACVLGDVMLVFGALLNLQSDA